MADPTENLPLSMPTPAVSVDEDPTLGLPLYVNAGIRLDEAELDRLFIQENGG